MLYVYVCMNIYIYTYTYIYIHTYIHTHTHTLTHKHTHTHTHNHTYTQLVFYGFYNRDFVIQSVLDGTSDVAITIQPIYEDFLRKGRFKASDFMYVGPDYVVPGTRPMEEGMFLDHAVMPAAYLSATPCKCVYMYMWV
jgi:hypothetical protein